ncbi:MAG: hypothetical protein SWC40_11590 [Thermodesulfobacteriota bacterium]|nr:hypothetical protein [Thermodesulfobacteriota bacterium]
MKRKLYFGLLLLALAPVAVMCKPAAASDAPAAAESASHERP